MRSTIQIQGDSIGCGPAPLACETLAMPLAQQQTHQNLRVQNAAQNLNCKAQKIKQSQPHPIAIFFLMNESYRRSFAAIYMGVAFPASISHASAAYRETESQGGHRRQIPRPDFIRLRSAEQSQLFSTRLQQTRSKISPGKMVPKRQTTQDELQSRRVCVNLPCSPAPC